MMKQDFLHFRSGAAPLALLIAVSIGVMVLRKRAPDLPRSFMVPLYPVTPILSIAGALWIVYNLRPITIYVFLIWVGVAFLFYFFYSRHHSHLGRNEHVGLATEDNEP